MGTNQIMTCVYCGQDISMKRDSALSWNRDPYMAFCNAKCHGAWIRTHQQFEEIPVARYGSPITEAQIERAGRLASEDEVRGGQTLSLAYLMEEVGEVAKALVEGDGDNYRHELLDVVNAALGMYNAADGRHEDIGPSIDRALDKWDRQLGEGT